MEIVNVEFESDEAYYFNSNMPEKNNSLSSSYKIYYIIWKSEGQELLEARGLVTLPRKFKLRKQTASPRLCDLPRTLVS